MRSAGMALAIVAVSALIASARPAPSQGQPWLGVVMNERGVELIDIADDSPAEDAGLRVGDHLVAVDGAAISSIVDLQGIVRRRKVGQVVDVELIRKGKTRKVKITLGEMPGRDELREARWRKLLDRPVKAFELSRVHGKAPTTSKDLAGKVVVIEFLSTWCQPCKGTYKSLGKLQERYASDGLVVIGVSTEDEKALESFASRESLPFTIAHDPQGKFQQHYWAQATPTFVVIDRDGVIRSLGSGASLAFDHAVFTAERLIKED